MTGSIMLTRTQCLAHALEMDLRAAASGSGQYRQNCAALALGWRSIAQTARFQDGLIAAISRIE